MRVIAILLIALDCNLVVGAPPQAPPVPQAPPCCKPLIESQKVGGKAEERSAALHSHVGRAVPPTYLLPSVFYLPSPQMQVPVRQVYYSGTSFCTPRG